MTTGALIAGLGAPLGSNERNAACAFAADEFIAIHAVCDRAGVSTEAHGEKLSVSQRVRLLAAKSAGRLP